MNAVVETRLQRANWFVKAISDRSNELLEREAWLDYEFRELEQLEHGISVESWLPQESQAQSVGLVELNFMHFKMRYRMQDLQERLVEQMGELETARYNRYLVLRLIAGSVKQRFTGLVAESYIESIKHDFLRRYPYYDELAGLAEDLKVFYRSKALTYIYAQNLPHEASRALIDNLANKYLLYQRRQLRIPFVSSPSGKLEFWRYFFDESLPESVSSALIELLSSTQSCGVRERDATNLKALREYFSIMSESFIQHECISGEIFSEIIGSQLFQENSSHADFLRRQIVKINAKIAQINDALGTQHDNSADFDISQLSPNELANPRVMHIFKQQMYSGNSWKQLLHEELVLEAQIITQALRAHILPRTGVAQLGEFGGFFDNLNSFISHLLAYFAAYDAETQQAAKRKQLREYSKQKWLENYDKIQQKSNQQFSAPTTAADLQNAFSKRGTAQMQRSYSKPRTITIKRANGQKRIQAARLEEDEVDFYY